jgi:transposase-like protein
MAGRPPTCIYDPDIHPFLAEQYAREGCINKEIADRLGISRSTFYNWRREHEEFREALKDGKEVVDAKVEKALLTEALGGNFNAQKFWLNNRRPERWREKSEVEHSGALTLHFDKEDEGL